jgi:NAD(P)H-dependent flavin oxidoreductase YrpB (nitropropane dioxygenase family)
MTTPPALSPAPAGNAAAGDALALPTVIQGGMGIGVSSWRLASAVSRTGQLGVVSGTGLDIVVLRRLQDGDAGGHIRRALEHFPVPALAQEVLKQYFRPEGRAPGQPYAPVPKLRPGSHRSAALAVVGNFAEVWLAKEGHDGLVGINFLEKIQIATPAAAYGAMLAGVDFVLMGAGIPAEIPNLLNRLAAHEAVSLNLHVHGASQSYAAELDPVALTGGGLPPLHRPFFLAIISADILASRLAREDLTRPDGFVVEGPRAGGHNAPPRGRMVLDDGGEPVFGPRDQANLEKIAAVGLPFWLAGGYSSPEHVARARELGAVGVQVGSLFALAEESGLAEDLRRETLARLAAGTLEVRTDPLASPTGFPFKVATLPGTQSDEAVHQARPRLCDIGHLSVPFERAPGVLGYRCASEPVHMYTKKGGDLAETVGRKCLCNALLADIGLGQVRKDGYAEQPLVTMGQDLAGVAALLATHPDGWTAADAVAHLLG